MHHKIVITFLITLMLSLLLAIDKSCNRNLSKINNDTNVDYGYFDINRITSDFSNDGMFVTHLKSGKQGMEWPKYMGVGLSYVSGLWIADSSEGEVRVTAAEYASEFSAGPFGSDFESLRHKVYTINKIDFDSPLTNPDFINWPVEDDAPWIDANGDGIYNINDGDIPDMLGDQMHWYVCNDSIQNNHSVFRTSPLNVELQVTTWGYNGSYNGQNLQDVMFVKTLLINMGQSNIENGYVGIWNDSDLGDGWDDWVGCDTTLNLGYSYNDGNDNEYGNDPPAQGITILQGPIIQSDGSTANCFGRKIENFQNIPMSSFIKYT